MDSQLKKVVSSNLVKVINNEVKRCVSFQLTLGKVKFNGLRSLLNWHNIAKTKQ